MLRNATALIVLLFWAVLIVRDKVGSNFHMVVAIDKDRFAYFTIF